MFESKQTGEPASPNASLGGPGTGIPSGPSQQAVEDMFAGSDPLKRGNRPSPFVPKGESPPFGGPFPPPQSFAPKLPQPSQPVIAQETEHEGSSGLRGKNVLMFIGVVVIVGIGVGAAAFFLTRKSNGEPSFDVNQFVNVNESLGTEETNANVPLETVNSNSVSDGFTNVDPEPALLNQEPVVPVTRNVNREQINANIPVPEPLDRDQDGLTLEQEGVLGTSDSLADTDLDGLTDWDEVKVYQSDPLKADTDGDGYVDGSEVKKGYSPIISGQ